MSAPPRRRRLYSRREELVLNRSTRMGPCGSTIFFWLFYVGAVATTSPPPATKKPTREEMNSISVGGLEWSLAAVRGTYASVRVSVVATTSAPPAAKGSTWDEISIVFNFTSIREDTVRVLMDEPSAELVLAFPERATTVIRALSHYAEARASIVSVLLSNKNNWAALIAQSFTSA